MTFTAEQQPAKRRGRSRNVTRAEIRAAWDLLRAAASSGSVPACAALIALSEGKPLHLESNAA